MKNRTLFISLFTLLLWCQFSLASGLWDFLKQFGNDVTSAANQMVTTVQTATGAGSNPLQNNLTGIIGVVQQAVGSIVESSSADAINAALDAVNAAASLAEKYGQEVAKGAIDQAVELLNQAIAQADGLPDSAKVALQMCALQLGTAASNVNVPAVVDVATNAVASALENFSKEAMLESLQQMASKVGDESSAIINGLLEQIKNATDEGVRNELIDKLEEYLASAGLSEDVREQALKVLDKLRNGDLADGLAEGVNLALEMAKNEASNVLGELLGEDAAQELLTILSDLAQGNYSLDEALGLGLEEILNALPESTSDALQELVSSILGEEGSLNVAEALHDLVEVASKDAMAGLLNLVGIDENVQQEVLEAISSILDGDWSNAWNISKDALLDTISNAVEKVLGENSAEIVRNAAESLLNAGTNLLNDAAEYVSNLGTMLQEGLQNALNDQLNKLVEKYPALGKVLDALGIDKNNIIGSISNIWNSLQDMPAKLQEMMTKLVGDISNYLNDLLGKLQDFGLEMLENLLNQVVDWVKNGISGLLDSIKDAVKASLGSLIDKLSSLKDAAESFSGYFLKSESHGNTPELIDSESQQNNQRVLQFNGN